MKNWKIQPGSTKKTVYIILTVILAIFIFLGFYKGIYIKAVFTDSIEEFLGKSFTPLSWFVLAKGHSFIHTHINFVLWDLPFILFGIVLILYIISILFAYASKSDRLSRLLFKVESIRKRG